MGVMATLSSAPEIGTAVGERLALAIDLANEAGELTRHAFGARGFDVGRKRDGSFVTSADRDAETLVRGRIRRAFGDDGVVGEEYGASAGGSGYTWFIDPIDGTKSFVHGVPLFGNLIGVERDGRIVAGVINMPVLGEMVYASEGRGAWHMRAGMPAVPARVSDTASLREALLITTSYHYFQKKSATEKLATLHGAFGDSRGWSDCYAHVLVATGRADAVVEPGQQPWDLAASVVILKEAGGKCTGWDGMESAHCPNAVLSNGVLHGELLRMLGDGCEPGA